MTDPVRPPTATEESRAEAPPPMGDNNPPPYDLHAMQARVDDIKKWAAAAGDWLDLEAIETEEQAQYLNDFIAGARKKVNAIEADRKAEKKPHAEAASAVDEAYRSPKTMIERSVKLAKDLLTPFMQKKQAEVERLQREAEQKAAAERKKAADELAAANARNDVAGQVEAEAAAKAAEKATKAAAKPAKAQVASATGGGRTMSMRTVKDVSIDNINALFRHYREDEKLHECLLNLAKADVRRADVDDKSIPGIIINERKVAA